MRSVADAHGDYYDIRSIYLEGCYFSIDAAQADQLAIFFYKTVNAMLSDVCIVDWQFEKKRLVDIESSLQKNKASNGHYSFGTDAFVRTNRMKNVTALRGFQKERRTHIVKPNRNLGSASEAMMRLRNLSERKAESILASSVDYAEAKSKILDLFSLDRVPYNSELYTDDFMANFWCMPMEETNGERYCGWLLLKISAYTVEEEINAWAEQLKQLSIKMQALVENLNVCIMLNSSQEPYSRYFGTENSVLQPRTTNMNLYARLLYCTEVGWTNLICKSTRTLGILPETKPGLRIIELENGGLCVESEKSIEDTGIELLKTIKAAMYPVILPRSKLHLYRGFTIRPLWEAVPVFDDEISVSDQGVAFVHQGGVDKESLLVRLHLEHVNI